MLLEFSPRFLAPLCLFAAGFQMAAGFAPVYEVIICCPTTTIAGRQIVTHWFAPFTVIHAVTLSTRSAPRQNAPQWYSA